MSNDGSAPTHFTCDIDDCSQVTTDCFPRYVMACVSLSLSDRRLPVNEPTVLIVGSRHIKHRRALSNAVAIRTRTIEWNLSFSLWNYDVHISFFSLSLPFLFFFFSCLFSCSFCWCGSFSLFLSNYLTVIRPDKARRSRYYRWTKGSLLVRFAVVSLVCFELKKTYYDPSFFVLFHWFFLSCAFVSIRRGKQRWIGSRCMCFVFF